MEDVERYGIIEVTNMALRRVDPNNNLPLHVSFDIDSLDSLEAPSTGTPGKVV
jgi:arginase